MYVIIYSGVNVFVAGAVAMATKLCYLLNKDNN